MLIEPNSAAIHSLNVNN